MAVPPSHVLVIAALLGTWSPARAEAPRRAKAWLACLAKPPAGCKEDDRFDDSRGGDPHVVVIWRCEDQRVTVNVRAGGSGGGDEVQREHASQLYLSLRKSHVAVSTRPADGERRLATLRRLPVACPERAR